MFDFLYTIKEAVRSLFMYPLNTISVSDSGHYDDYWKDKRGSNIGALSLWQKKRADIILKIIQENIVDGQRINIADIGCGDGSILKYIKDQMSDVVDVIFGYDTSTFALERAVLSGVQAALIDIRSLDSFDQVDKSDYFLLLETIEHVPHSEEVLLAAFQKAQRGVFISVPNTGFIMHRLRLLLGRTPLQWRLHPGEHVRFWTHADMKWWLESLTFKGYKIIFYKGVPILNKIYPSLFAAGMVVYIPK